MLTPLRACVLLAIVWLLPISEIAEARGPRGGAGGRSAGGFSRGGTGFSAPAPPGVRSNAPTAAVRGGRPDVAPSQPRKSRDGPYMNQAASAAQNHHNGPQPHSPAWHAQHPSAWQHTHPHADAVAVASTAAVTSWLAYGVHPATTTTSTTVVYGTPATADSAAPTADPDPAVAAGTGPEWLALGVYELSPSAAVASSQMVQLSISQSGVLRGVYFDHLTGTTQNLSGSVDTATQHVEWSLEGNPSARFATTLTDLTQPRGAVTVTLPNGEQTWAISRAGGV